MTTTQRLKSTARRMADRVVVPYVDELERRLRPSAPADSDVAADTHERSDVPSVVFHNVLHELRTYELRRARGRYERVVSVGASGRWYFDWFERAVGPVLEHVGVEAFEPEPVDLPSYATWIATTADRFEGIEDDSVDIVFAGQTTEHLWADELAGFLDQARRVLRSDGQLILDSPNRLVTEHLNWSHGGHSVELSGAEIAELIELAGFEVTTLRGVWRCQFGAQILQLEEQIDDGAQLVRRILDAPDAPDDCFVWWLVARPHGAPDTAGLFTRCRQLYEANWPTRLCRGMWPGPGHRGPRAAPGEPLVAESLPFMLDPGRFRFTARLAHGATGDIGSADLAMWLPGMNMVHHASLDDATVTADSISWIVDQPELMFALTMRLTITASAPVEVSMPLAVERIT